MKKIMLTIIAASSLAYYLWFSNLLHASSDSRARSSTPSMPSVLKRAAKSEMPNLSSQSKRIIAGAEKQLGKTRYYDPAYVSLSYPGGDVPIIKGVCTDVVIRALGHAEIDLQQLVHEGMRRHFSLYPKKWGLKRADKNIDHRRVSNLQTFFKRQGWQQEISAAAVDYLPGDIVSWKFENGLDHIGVVVNKTRSSKNPLVIHNAGAGAQKEDVLFEWKITGHYRVK